MRHLLGATVVLSLLTGATAAQTTKPLFVPYGTPAALRPPSTSDAGAAGAFWNTERGLWQSQHAGVPADWLPVAELPLPCDAVPGAVGCFGIKRIAANYAGPIYGITCAPGGTSVTFDAPQDGIGLPDYRLIDGKCQSAEEFVSTWYDQSGDGNKAAQSTAGQQFHIASTNMIGDARAVVQDPQVRFTTGSTPTQSMALPSSLTLNANSVEALVTARLASTSQNAELLQLNGSTNDELAFWTGSTSPTVDALSQGNHITTPSTFAGALTPQVVGFLNTGSGVLVSGNDQASTYGVGSSSYTLAGGSIGTGSTFGNGQVEYAGIVVGPAQTQAAYQGQAVPSMYRAFKVAPQTKVKIVIEGDSRDECFGPAGVLCWARQLETLLNLPAFVRVTALSGQTAVQRAAAFPIQVAPFYDPAAPVFIVVVEAAINDLTGGASAATTFAAMQSMATQAHNLGTNVRVVMMTPEPVSNPAAGVEAQRTALIALIKAGAGPTTWSVIDTAGDASIGTTTQMALPAISADGTHLTTLGNGFVAQDAAAGLNALLHN